MYQSAYDKARAENAFNLGAELIDSNTYLAVKIFIERYLKDKNNDCCRCCRCRNTIDEVALWEQIGNIKLESQIDVENGDITVRECTTVLDKLRQLEVWLRNKGYNYP